MASEAMRVLIVEDEVLIALYLEDILMDIGHQVIDHASQVDEALEAAAKSDIDFAVLDINLSGTESFPVADVLRRRGIPFIFATANYELINEEYRDEIVLTKPYESREIETGMEQAVSRKIR